MKDFDTHGGTFVPQGFMQIEAGGTHEENPNGGVQVGLDPNGIPNMVEEDENIYQDFVYSNQITADAPILKEFNLPEKYAGKPYSDIVNEYVDERRPEDPIANRTMNAMLIRLADAQEEQKKRKEQAELEKELANLSPEELAQLEEQLVQMENGGQEAQPQMFADGGDLEKMSKWLADNVDVSDTTREILLGQLTGENRSMTNTGLRERFREIVPTHLFGEKNLGKYMNRFQEMGIPFDDAWKLANMYNADANNKARQPYYDKMRDKFYDSYIEPGENTIAPVVYGGELPEVEITPEVAPVVTPSVAPVVAATPKVSAPVINRNRTLPAMNGLISEPSTTIPGRLEYRAMPDVSHISSDSNDSSDNNTENSSLPTWPRYAGAITSGLFGLYNAFQRPDTYKVPRVAPTLMRTKLSTLNPAYRPQDANLAVNDVLASGAGTARGLRNSGLGPSTGAALVALDKNIGKNIGTARTQVAGYNDNLLNNVIGQINNNRQAEAQIGLNRDRINTSLLYDAALRNAQNSLTEQQLNYGAEGQHYGAIGSQMDQVAAALSGIGRENMAMNMINNNPAFSYQIGPDGTVTYRPRKCGGMLKRYKK